MADVAIVLLQEARDFGAREWVEAGQGLALAAGEGLSATGHYVRTVRQREAIGAALRDEPPGVLFLAVGNGQESAAHAMLDQLRGISARTCIAVGGTHGTLQSHQFTAHQAVGAVILGEWVEALAELGKAIRDGGAGSDINGVWWRGRRGWQLTARRTHNPDLSVWPNPRLEDFRAAEIARLRGGSLPILASRGFPFKTLFSAEPILRHLHNCEAWYHPRPPKRIAREAQQIVMKFDVKEFEFADDIFPWDMAWTTEFMALWLEHVRRPFHIRTAAEHMSRERLTPLRDAGLASVELCLESGNDVLRARHSDLNRTNAQVREVLERCVRMGIRTRARLLLGLPHETAKSLKDSVSFAKSMPLTRANGELYDPWPESSHFAEVERSLTGSTVARARIKDIPEIRRDVIEAMHTIQAIDSVRRAKSRPEPEPGIVWDGLAHFPKAKVRSPLEAAALLETFTAPTGPQEVVALRLPAELSYRVNLPTRPLLEFGVLIRPALPGERTRQPVSFSVKVTQGGRTWRLFQKILIQALDPDSRRWHWFKLPLAPAKAGAAELSLETILYGVDPGLIPEEDLWAGWGKLQISSLEDALDRGLSGDDFEE
jgi:hypothetical protein